MAFVVAEGTPVIDAGGVDTAERGGHGFEIRVFADEALNGGAEFGVFDGEDVVRVASGGAGDGGLVTEDTEHDVNVRGELAIEGLGSREATAFLPEGGAVVEVVTDGDSVAFGGLAGLDGEFGGGFGEAREDASGMQPAAAEGAKEVVKVKVAHF